MTKQTYIGNGRNKNFYFTFPFFSPDEVLVKINDIVAVEYGLFCNQGVSNQDFPFTGGHVKFTKPPKPTDIITIERNLQYNRVIDYQETAKINPTTLNQDMNYFFESLKDIKSILNEFNEKYAEFTDTKSANDLKERINAVTEQIDDFAEQIETIGDITTIQTSINSLSQSVSDLTSTIATHTTNIGTNTNDIATLKGYDYVIESQTPTAENNYTWYRKYKSGWVEQGGYVSQGGGGISVSLPVKMSSVNYHIILTGKHDSNTAGSTTSVSTMQGTHPLQTTGFYVNNYVENAGNRGNSDAFWWTCFGFYEITI